MKVNDIHAFVNALSQQAYGETAVVTADNTGLVALGDTVLSSATSKDAFIGVLVDRVGETIVSSRKYTRKQRQILKDAFTYGSILQKIYTEPYQATKNPKYDLTDGESIDQYVVNKPKSKQKLFDGVNNFEIDATIWDTQLESAFTSWEKMAAFIDSVFTAIDNTVEVELEQCENMAIANFIGEKLAASVAQGAKGIKVIHCLQAFNSDTGASLTAAQAWTSVDFWKWFGKKLRLTMKQMEKMSMLFNDEGNKRHTPREYQVLDLHSEALEALDTYLQSDTFHNEFTALPNGNEIIYWQGSGEEFGVGETTSIDIVTSSGKTVKQAGVIALLHDIEAIGMMVDKPRITTSPYNAKGEFTNYFYKQEMRYYNDMSENGVVFTLTDTPYTAG